MLRPLRDFSEVDSNIPGTNAIYGATAASTGQNFATSGFASGTSHTSDYDRQNSAGVYGEAIHSTADVNGVTGRVGGAGSFAFGVYGEAEQAIAYAMGFKNINGAAPIVGYMGSVSGGVSYGLNTNGHITGSNVSAPRSAPSPRTPRTRRNRSTICLSRRRRRTSTSAARRGCPTATRGSTFRTISV